MADSRTVVRELTLMLAYLTSWVEKPFDARRAWKGYDFDVLNELSGQGLIGGSRRSKLSALIAPVLAPISPPKWNNSMRNSTNSGR